jgi:hypothetical protein
MLEVKNLEHIVVLPEYYVSRELSHENQFIL